MTNTVLTGDALEVCARSDGLVDCVVTSPPFYALRDYGVDGQLGREPNVDAYADGLRRADAAGHRARSVHRHGNGGPRRP